MSKEGMYFKLHLIGYVRRNWGKHTTIFIKNKINVLTRGHTSPLIIINSKKFTSYKTAFNYILKLEEKYDKERSTGSRRN